MNKGLGDDGKIVEVEYDIQRSKTELYERVVIPTVVYGSEEKNRSI